MTNKGNNTNTPLLDIVLAQKQASLLGSIGKAVTRGAEAVAGAAQRLERKGVQAVSNHIDRRSSKKIEAMVAKWRAKGQTVSGAPLRKALETAASRPEGAVTMPKDLRGVGPSTRQDALDDRSAFKKVKYIRRNSDLEAGRITLDLEGLKPTQLPKTKRYFDTPLSAGYTPPDRTGRKQASKTTDAIRNAGIGAAGGAVVGAGVGVVAAALAGYISKRRKQRQAANEEKSASSTGLVGHKSEGKTQSMNTPLLDIVLAQKQASLLGGIGKAVKGLAHTYNPSRTGVERLMSAGVPQEAVLKAMAAKDQLPYKPIHEEIAERIGRIRAAAASGAGSVATGAKNIKGKVSDRLERMGKEVQLANQQRRRSAKSDADFAAWQESQKPVPTISGAPLSDLLKNRPAGTAPAPTPASLFRHRPTRAELDAGLLENYISAITGRSGKSPELAKLLRDISAHNVKKPGVTYRVSGA